MLWYNKDVTLAACTQVHAMWNGVPYIHMLRKIARQLH